ncbi:MAG: cytochrome b/b6 domain-containing protein [Henriciella sp.]|uniref:cytochrome b/b6 domain-containing protein n=1 Tax=Henriciella sp. TaxID=1968823 RepID=UPI0032EB1F3D
MTNKKAAKPGVRVWDPLVRFGHWGIVAGFFTAYLSGDEFPAVHVWAGYAVAVLVLIRLVWGFVGTKHARFSNFVRGPGAVFTYLRGLFGGKAERHLGHNPAGAAMILALIIGLSGTAGTGMALLAVEDGEGPLAGIIAQQGEGHGDAGSEASYDEDDEHDGDRDEGAEELLEELHSAFVYFTLALVALHVFGVVASSLVHRENLVRAMVTGRKREEE